MSREHIIQPIIRQEQFCYRELVFPNKKNCYCYEFYANAECALIPDGDYHILWDIDANSRVIFGDDDLLNVVFYMEGNGHRYFGVAISYQYKCRMNQEAVDDILKEFSLCGGTEEAFTSCISALQRILFLKSNHPLLLYAVKRMKESKGRVAVESIALEKGYTTRQMERVFKDCYGCSPKTINRLIRVEYALHILEENKELSFSRVSEMLGYSDASHFQREFKYFTGMSPGRFAGIYYNRENAKKV